MLIILFPLCNVQDATTVNDAVTERRSVVSSWEWIIVGVDYPRCLFGGAEQSRAEQSKVAELLSPENAKS